MRQQCLHGFGGSARLLRLHGGVELSSLLYWITTDVNAAGTQKYPTLGYNVRAQQRSKRHRSSECRRHLVLLSKFTTTATLVYNLLLTCGQKANSMRFLPHNVHPKLLGRCALQLASRRISHAPQACTQLPLKLPTCPRSHAIVQPRRRRALLQPPLHLPTIPTLPQQC